MAKFDPEGSKQLRPSAQTKSQSKPKTDKRPSSKKGTNRQIEEYAAKKPDTRKKSEINPSVFAKIQREKLETLINQKHLKAASQTKVDLKKMTKPKLASASSKKQTDPTMQGSRPQMPVVVEQVTDFSEQGGGYQAMATTQMVDSVYENSLRINNSTAIDAI